MVRVIRFTLLAVAFSVAWSSARAKGALVIGTFNSARASVGNLLTGDYSHSAISTINSLYPGTSYVSFPTITPAALTGVDILMISSDKNGVDPISALSSSEQSAMLDFVKAGGRALILADAWDLHVPAAQSMVGPFGLIVADDGFEGALYATPTATPNAIINGPYGNTPTVDLYGAGIFTDLGPFATGLANEDVTGKPVLASIPAHALSSTSGRVVLYTDTQMFIDDAVGGFFSDQVSLFENTMNYLVNVPEPTTATLEMGALGAFAAFVIGRRKMTQCLRR